MKRRRLKWLALLAPVGFVAVFEYARYALQPILPSWQGKVLLYGVALFTLVFFYGVVFTLSEQTQQRLEAQNRELVALRSANLDISSELSLERVLQKIVEQARNLIGTRYGAIAIYSREGPIEAFVASGIGSDLSKRIGAKPTGKGLLGVTMREGQALRMGNIDQDARSCGFPDHHPEMRSLLAVPVICRLPYRGNLYLSEKIDDGTFTEEEQETLARFATQAAIAVDNARLHAQVHEMALMEERLRLAHEMHDGQAQVLAYVNTKVQAIQELLHAGQLDQADDQLDQLAKAARDVYADIREGILGLRTLVDEERGLTGAIEHFANQWEGQVGIPVTLSLSPIPALGTEAELHILRILQESIANVRKHAQATSLAVDARIDGHELLLSIVDDGIGFEPEGLARTGTPRFGLATMRERADAIGARLDIRSRRRVGTQIDLRYPVHQENPS